MKRFTKDGRSKREGQELIRAQSHAEEEAPLGLSLEGGLAGPRRYSRRQAIGLLGGSLAGFSLLSLGLEAPAKSTSTDFDLPFKSFDHITLQWVGDTVPFSLRQATTTPTNTFLDGRTQNGTVGLAPNTNPPYTGTRWEIVRRNPGTWPPSWWLKCLGDIPGPQWLDGRTGNGTVGLAPDRSASYTGTRWEITSVVVPHEPTRSYILKCLGDVPGPRMLRGYPFRSANGTVGLVDENSGTYSQWKVTILPQ
jgi:hypothetical protein